MPWICKSENNLARARSKFICAQTSAIMTGYASYPFDTWRIKCFYNVCTLMLLLCLSIIVHVDEWILLRLYIIDIATNSTFLLNIKFKTTKACGIHIRLLLHNIGMIVCCPSSSPTLFYHGKTYRQTSDLHKLIYIISITY